jgi:predicted transcriptional regulator
MKKIVIGIMSQDNIRKRVLAIARGEYKPRRNEPKVWFPSMKSVAEVLSDSNRALLKMIAEIQPESLTALADAAGRQPGNLSRTLKTMEHYGFVELKKQNKSVKPIVKATEFEIHAA